MINENQPKHMYPHNLCMTLHNWCDYTGSILSGKSSVAYCVPYNYLLGININEDLNMEERAKEDIIRYCLENSIYPINEMILQSMSLDGAIYVKRSNGNNENGWKIVCNESTSIIHNEICVLVSRNDLQIERRSSLRDICELNNKDYTIVLSTLVDSLKNWYYASPSTTANLTFNRQ